MRKILLLGVLLFMAAPAMASSVDISCVVDGNMVTVSYDGDPDIVRAFGLDIEITSGDAVITKVEMVSTDYRIFPGQIVIEDGEVTDYGTPYAAADLGDANLAVEMGSLYAADDPCKQDPPPTSGQLFKFWVTCGSVGSHFAITENTVRGGVVMEDPCDDPAVTLCDDDICGSSCTVPNVVNMTQADANIAIDACNLNLGVVTEECNDTVADGLVLRSTPIGGTAVACDSNVDIVLSNNPALPGAATLVSPAANAKCVLLAATCSWTVGSGTVTQDIRWGTTNPPPVVSAGVGAGITSYDPPGSMVVYTKYYWTVDEINECGEKTAGTVRCFITGPTDAVGVARCCLNEASPCLGNYNGDTRVNSTDVSTLLAFVQSLPSPYRCNTIAGQPSTCPTCGDVNGDGRINSTDVSVLLGMVQSWPSPYRQNCPWPNCP